MTETTAGSRPDEPDKGEYEGEGAWSFVAVAAAIVLGLSLLLGLAMLLHRLLGNPPA
jgi:hypothetical protein